MLELSLELISKILEMSSRVRPEGAVAKRAALFKVARQVAGGI